MKQWFEKPVQTIDHQHIENARRHQSTLTKPIGSLGRLEEIAEVFCGWQSKISPRIEKVCVAVFAADHGVCQQGVSAFPQTVTTQMIANFLEGGAAISVLSRELDADFSVINVGTATPLPDGYTSHKQLINAGIAPGTADFSTEAAMTNEQLEKALRLGQEQVENIETNLFIGGEMGIGNTTSASAIYAALLPLPPEHAVGPGTGVDSRGLLRKQEVIAQSLDLHRQFLNDPYQVLRCLGGLEIAALVGSYIACAQKGVPVLVDGFICTAAALLAVELNPGVRDWLLFSHQSAEPAHHLALEKLNAKPLLQLEMRLGEGSGAAVAVPLLNAALVLHNKMATFSQAGVSEHD